MVRRQHALTDILARDPDIAELWTGIGGSRPLNNGFRDHRPEASRPAQSKRRRDHHPSSPAARQSTGREAVLAGGAGPECRRPDHPHAIPIHTAGLGHRRTERAGRPKCWRSCRSCRMLRDVASDQQTSSGMVSLAIDRDQASRFGIQPAAIDQALYDAFGQRQAAQFFTQANSYHVVLEITPSLQADPASLQKLYLKSPLTGQMVPLSAMTRYDTQHVTYLSINHQGQFPAVTLSFNLAPGARLGDAVDAINRVAATTAAARNDDRHLPGHSAGLPELPEDPALLDSRRPGGGVHHSGYAVRELHPSADHSVDAAVGRRRRIAGAVHVPPRPVGHRADRHHSAHRHREEERHHDGGLRHPGGARTGPLARAMPYARPACCGSGRS